MLYVRRGTSRLLKVSVSTVRVCLCAFIYGRMIEGQFVGPKCVLNLWETYVYIHTLLIYYKSLQMLGVFTLSSSENGFYLQHMFCANC